jgi:diguanylate cyclase (GGDEF)-like protein/PAS domain S-box-containing protein
MRQVLPPNIAYSALLLIVGTTCLFVAIIIFQTRQNATGAAALTSLLFALAWWDITYGLFWAGTPALTKNFWLDITYVGAVTVPVALFVFSLQITNRQGWLKRPLAIVIYLEPVFVLVSLFTDPYHGLFFAGKRVENSAVILHGGPVFWLNVVYSYVLILFSTILIVRAYLGSSGIYRRQLGIILFGIGFAWLNSIIVVADLNPLPGADNTPFSFTVTAVAFAFALGKYRLLDLVPVARDSLVEKMTDGLLVIDAQNRIVDMNPAAQSLLNINAETLGRPVKEVIKEWPHYEEIISDFKQAQIEIELEAEPKKQVDMQVIPIKDGSEKDIGRLITLRDITDRKQVEAKGQQQHILSQSLQETAQALNSTLDYEGVLEKILVNVGRVVPIDSANIALLDDTGVLDYVLFYGYMEHNVLKDELQSLSLGDSPIFKKVFETGEPIIIPDTHADPDWIVIPSGAWIRSYAVMPIRIKERVVGVLNLDSAAAGMYTPEHIHNLRAFADQVAIAVENARLFAVAERELVERKQAEEKLRQQNEYYSMLHQITAELLDRPNPESLLNHITERAAALINAQHGFMFLSEDDFLILRAATRGFAHKIGRSEPKPGTGVLGRVWQDGESFAVEKYTAWELHDPDYDSENLVAIAGVPIRAEGSMAGVLEVANTDHARPFSEAEIEILERFALLASLVLDNTQLFSGLQSELKERVQVESQLREANAQLETQMKQIRGLQLILREQAVRDPLTGLYNRRYLTETQDRELARAAREGYSVSFVMIDIDHFKGVNDMFGHDAGDHVLRKLSALIQDYTRVGGIICRYGGEEILAILPNVTAEVAFQITERWRQAFMDFALPAEKGHVKATISCGISAYPGHGSTANELITLADKAMYQAKAAGRNQVVIWRATS